jgi:two-component system sensor histidine kinase BaeS
VRLEIHLLLSGALGSLTDRQRHALEVVSRNVQRWADGEAAFLQSPADAAAREFDLAALVREAVDARQTQALKQGVSLATRVPHALPVRANPEDVHDILDRFLDRALEATSSGAAVDVEARPAGGEALVEVRDSGAGWSAREVKSAFEPWAGRAPRADGPGLSLPYARQLVEAQGGRAWAESDGVGQGVLLGFALPLVKGRAHDSFASPGKSHESSGQGDKTPAGSRLIPPGHQP